MDAIYEIALCDTKPEYVEKAKKIIEYYTNRISRRFKVLTYTQPQKLLSDIESGKIIPIMLYIDVDLEGNSGIEIVKSVNKLAKECRVIYLAKQLKYNSEIYETNHFYFVRKDELNIRLPQIFAKLGRQISNRDEYLRISLKNNRYAAIRLADIIFLERQGRYTKICTKNRIYQARETVDMLEEALISGQFVRCHYSYIVSLYYVAEYKRESFSLDENDINIPISRKYQACIKEKYLEYQSNKRKQ